MSPAAETGTYGSPVLRLHRVFDYPREVVFDAWTDARLLARWFAPHGCTLRGEPARKQAGIGPGIEDDLARVVEDPVKTKHRAAVGSRFGCR